jgi:hypothetical protein
MKPLIWKVLPYSTLVIIVLFLLLVFLFLAAGTGRSWPQITTPEELGQSIPEHASCWHGRSIYENGYLYCLRGNRYLSGLNGQITRVYENNPTFRYGDLLEAYGYPDQLRIVQSFHFALWEFPGLHVYATVAGKDQPISRLVSVAWATRPH